MRSMLGVVISVAASEQLWTIIFVADNVNNPCLILFYFLFLFLSK